MEIINYLADKLAVLLGISPPAARGLIKLSIKDELGPFIELKRINYNDLRNVLKNSLKKRLVTLKISKYVFIVNNLLNELEMNQSLITMEGVKL
jgi:hypothetical protein